MDQYNKNSLVLDKISKKKLSKLTKIIYKKFAFNLCDKLDNSADTGMTNNYEPRTPTDFNHKKCITSNDMIEIINYRD